MASMAGLFCKAFSRRSDGFLEFPMLPAPKPLAPGEAPWKKERVVREREGDARFSAWGKVGKGNHPFEASRLSVRYDQRDAIFEAIGAHG